MARDFGIEVTDQRSTRRTRIVELRIRPEGGEEPFLAVASIYGHELYLNLPASSEASGFVDYLSMHIGEPTEPPEVKCSAPWNEHMVGPMQTVKWSLPSQAMGELEMILSIKDSQEEACTER